MYAISIVLTIDLFETRGYRSNHTTIKFENITQYDKIQCNVI